MRTEKGYRYTLQFPACTIDQQRAGEFLERVGSRKSCVIVRALTDYLQKHPDLLEVGGTIRVDAAAGLTKEEVRVLIREELARGNYSPSSEESDVPASADQNNIVDSMLDNLGLFN